MNIYIYIYIYINIHNILYMTYIYNMYTSLAPGESTEHYIARFADNIMVDANLPNANIFM